MTLKDTVANFSIWVRIFLPVDAASQMSDRGVNMTEQVSFLSIKIFIIQSFKKGINFILSYYDSPFIMG